MTATPSWLAALEALLNRGIDGSTQARQIAQQLDATALRVEVQGVVSIRASVAGGRLALLAADGPAEATLRGTPLGLLRLARASRPRNVPTTAEIKGDAELAHLYQKLIAAAMPDFEDEFARIVGDFPARRLSLLAQQAMAWAAHARRTAGQNVSEYLQEESRILVNSTELDEFLHGVDSLREAADRVEARLRQLERRLNGAA